MQKKYLRLLLLIIVFLSIISVLTITIFGDTYIYEINLNNQVKDINDIHISVEQEHGKIKIIDKKLQGNDLFLKLKGVEKGYVFINVKLDDNHYMEKFYIHNFNIITENSFLGKATGDIVFLLSAFILMIFILAIQIKEYKISMNDTIYKYKNINYLAFIIFLCFMIINQFIQNINNRGIENSIDRIINTVSFFSTIILPIFVIISILVFISNIVLLKKEGVTIRNMLGIILGLFLIVLPLIPDFLYSFILRYTNIDIFKERGLANYIYTYIELLIYTVVTYLECILFATIILAVKATRKKPKFNKDYVIVLGCKIREDGSLTPLLKGRVDRAIEFAKLQKEETGKDIVFIPSGGKGNDEVITEAQAIKNYLLDQGIKNKNIILEDKSTNTYENIKFSNKLIKSKNKDNIIFSTTNYHVFRAGIIATNQGLKIEGIGSKTKSYFWINAFIREYIATIYSEKKNVFKLFILFMIIILVFIILKHISSF